MAFGMAMLPIATTPAGAATCTVNNGDPFYHYLYQRSTDHYWNGVERFISRTAPQVHTPSTEHVAEWIGVTNPLTQCATIDDDGHPYISTCWLQAGYEVGQGPDNTVYSSRVIYSESNSTTSGLHPVVKYWPKTTIPQNTFFSVYYDGTVDSRGSHNFRSYFQTGSTPVFMIKQPIGDLGENADAETEIRQKNTDTCPLIDVNENAAWFGTNGSGTYGSNWSLFKTTDGLTWVEWVDPAITRGFISTHWSAVSLHNYSAFGSYDD